MINFICPCHFKLKYFISQSDKISKMVKKHISIHTQCLDKNNMTYISTCYFTKTHITTFITQSTIIYNSSFTETHSHIKISMIKFNQVCTSFAPNSTKQLCTGNDGKTMCQVQKWLYRTEDFVLRNTLQNVQINNTLK